MRAERVIRRDGRGDQIRARFITLVAPQAPGAPLPRLHLRTGDHAAVTVVEVEGVTRDVRDLVAWATETQPMDGSAVCGTAHAGVMRTSAGGKRYSWYADAVVNAVSRPPPFYLLEKPATTSVSEFSAPAPAPRCVALR